MTAVPNMIPSESMVPDITFGFYVFTGFAEDNILPLPSAVPYLEATPLFHGFASARVIAAQLDIETVSPSLTSQGFARVAYMRRVINPTLPLQNMMLNVQNHVARTLSGGQTSFKVVYLPAS